LDIKGIKVVVVGYSTESKDSGHIDFGRRTQIPSLKVKTSKNK